MQVTPPDRDIVLWGVGHTNAHVLRSWRMHPIPGARLTCVSDTPRAGYSGLLPAVLAGQVPRERMEIDLVRLASAAGARLVVGEGTGIDLVRRQLHVSAHPPVPFDLLSIGIGSVPSAPPGVALDPGVIAIKPMWSLLDRLEAGLLRLPADRPPRVVVVGGGAGGVEIALCLTPFIRARRAGGSPVMTLVDAGGRLLSGSSARAARLARRTLEGAGVTVLLGRRATSVGRGAVTLDDASVIQADLVLWATGAVAPPVLAGLGLPTDERGFLLARPTLQTVGDDSVFAVGDAGTIREAPTAKAGVYAVRQGPVLWENLGRRLEGLPPRPYAPQRRFLRLLNTGDGEAIADYRGFALKGRLVRHLKDRIDSSFMEAIP